MELNLQNFLCFLLCVATIEPSLCPSKWKKINDKCIYIGPPERNFEQNEVACAEMAANMITFESGSDYNEFSSLIPEGQQIYTAAKRVSVANGIPSYLWNGKKSETWLKWSKTNPNDVSLPSANCLTLFSDGYLYDSLCDFLFPTACQINLLENVFSNITSLEAIQNKGIN
ncbi:hypothetical protein B4U80_13047 [Leptotrombidium deliense]|uniref:C-type lectin domain-containing protein n=1 Tax=Leptotrombidium deliense TaxID=299467 RepID=A0A443SE32_9ACAR|nr:hypothetical protein B4U80_13047 [Leptotrombidium deliense]